MDIKILGALIVIVAVSAVAGVLVFNNMNPKTMGISNPIISSDNQTTVNNSTDNNNFTSSNTIFALSTYSLVNNQYNPSPSPSPNPDTMDHIISLFDAYLKSSYDQSVIPSMAVVIVQNGKIIYMNSLGVKNLATGEPVDENTLFCIGSATKQFSATNVAQLVSVGLMSWDDPISKYYPDQNEFQLYDNMTDKLTIRDCFTHRSGLPAGAGDDYYTYFNTSFSDTLYKLRYMENNTPFRSTFAYNNVIISLPGYSAARVKNTTWNNLIKENLLNPLGMTTADTSYQDFLKSPNHATPYYLLRNGTMKEYDVIPDPVGPAGGIYCSVSEMANWLKFQIADTGYYNGQKIVNKSELDETHKPQINVTDSMSKNGPTYGFGWFIADDNINHMGDSQSFHSRVRIYTSKGLGIFISANGGIYAQTYRDVLDDKFKDLLNGVDNADTWPAIKQYLDTIWKPEPPTPPIINQKLPISGYVGIYSNYLFGDVNITSSNDSLICYYGNNSRPYDLTHLNGDMFMETTNNKLFNFTEIHDDKADQVNVKFSNPENVAFNRTNST